MYLDGLGAASGEIRGNFDAIDCKRGTANGWAQVGDGRARVDIIVDGATVATVTPSSYRADLKAAGIGDGNFAFSWKIPDALRDSKDHAIEAKVGTRTLGTKNLNCPPRTFIEKYGMILAGGFVGLNFLGIKLFKKR